MMTKEEAIQKLMNIPYSVWANIPDSVWAKIPDSFWAKMPYSVWVEKIKKINELIKIITDK